MVSNSLIVSRTCKIQNSPLDETPVILDAFSFVPSNFFGYNSHRVTIRTTLPDLIDKLCPVNSATELSSLTLHSFRNSSGKGGFGTWRNYS